MEEKVIELSGIIQDENTDKFNDIDNKKVNKSEDILENAEFDLKSINNINFTTYLKNNNEDTIYIFPYETELYLIIQRKIEVLIKVATLIWNDLGDFGKLIPCEQIMIDEIRNKNHILHKLIAKNIKNYKLFKIPFYFIPIVRETFIKSKYGEMKGEWEIRIHKKMEIIKNRLPYKVQNCNFKLRDYQLNAISCWHDNGDFGTINVATAGGKTIMALQAIKDTQYNTLIAVPKVPLIEQWREDIHKFLGIDKKMIGIFSGNKKQILPITIGTYNSLMKYIEFPHEELLEIEQSDLDEKNKIQKILFRKKVSEILQNFFSLLILDESHHIPAPTFKKLALNSKALYRLSLSATCERYDKNESLLYFSAGKKIFELDYLQLCESNWVVPFVYNYIPVFLTSDENERYRKYGQNLEAKKQMTYFNMQKLYHINKICKLHVSNNQQILIFVTYVESAYKIYDELNENGIKSDLILSVENQKKKSDFKREKVVEKFKNKEISCVISTSVLDEGFNVPDCNVAIIVNGTSTSRQMIQRVGRIVRKSQNTNKIGYIYELTTEGDENTITIDYSNHLQRNFMIEDSEEYRKEKEILSESFWIFPYTKITEYAIELSKKRKIPLIKYNN